jgi:hypothetical protein
MKRALVLALAAACRLPAMADELIPSQLTGVWGSAESLFAGTTAQAELYLYADGFGLMIGSSAPSVISSGPDKGKPGMRITMGVPLRAKFDGATLTGQYFNPNNPQDTGPTLSCRYEETGPALHCTGLDKSTMIMKRRSSSLAPDIVQKIDEMRIALRAYAGKASALPPAPSTRP